MFRKVIPLLLLPFIVACSDKPESISLGTVENCDAAKQSCLLRYGNDVAVHLTLGPGVKPLEPFSVKLAVEGLEPDAGSMIADFQMRGMDMGINRYRLSREEGVWHGEVTLPVCTASRMDWFTQIEFSAEGKQYQAIFPFETVSN